MRTWFIVIDMVNGRHLGAVSALTERGAKGLATRLFGYRQFGYIVLKA